MKNLSILCIFTILTLKVTAKNDTLFVESKISLQTRSGELFGTLDIPEKFSTGAVVLFIAGSGPTDRNGNGPLINTDCTKKLATALAKNGIASVRYDKRGIAESKDAGKNEADLRFDNYINDAKDWIQLLKQDKRFSKIIIVGHSEGSLIGMVAAVNADKFISIAGVGQSADRTLKEQLSTQPKAIQDLSFTILDSLKSGKEVTKVDPMLLSLFRPSVQPYMISWFKYNPQNEIKKLKIPTLIIQGTNDIQVSVEDAKLLSQANPKAHLVLVKNMNHIFRTVEGNRQANIVTYNEPTLPIATELVANIIDFILKN